MKFSYLPNIKLYYIPSDEINAFSFGRESIGITEGAMRLDDNLLKLFYPMKLDIQFMEICFCIEFFLVI